MLSRAYVFNELNGLFWASASGKDNKDDISVSHSPACNEGHTEFWA